MIEQKYTIGIIGLGYVGLPLACAFAKKYNTIGFDINNQRVESINKGNDETGEISSQQLIKTLAPTGKMQITSNEKDLKKCNFYIITVPTPTDKNNKADLRYIYDATILVSKYLAKNDFVIYESTVYPGVTEEECVPILETESKLKLNKDFFVGYSPERINPGDKTRTVENILKITSGSSIESAEVIDNIYSSVISAGTYKAKSIKIAEAAKIIENTQRDLNIAFVNELSKIFSLMGIDTNEVLNAAATKWNFIKFSPGLVGGHCIGIDPYYLAQKAQELGYSPELILHSRKINESIAKHIVQIVIKKAIEKELTLKKTKALILGFTFKENCSDYRNTKVIDIVNELNSYNIATTVFDPNISIDTIKNEYPKVNLITSDQFDLSEYQIVILAVSHKEFFDLEIVTNNNKVIFDVKGILPIENVDARL
jgi:UDP-N-acetyl-D-galactosamine dehydrogenase